MRRPGSRGRSTTICGGPPGASDPTQRVIACALGSRAASSWPRRPRLTCSQAHESSTVSWRASPAAIQYARLSPIQPTVIASLGADGADQRARRHPEVGTTGRRHAADGPVRGVGRVRRRADDVGAVAHGRGEHGARTVGGGARRGIAGRRRGDAIAYDRDDRVLHQLEVERVLVAAMHAPLVAHRRRQHQIDLDAAARLAAAHPADPAVAVGIERVGRRAAQLASHLGAVGRVRLGAGARATFLAEAVVGQQRGMARLAAHRGVRGHVQVLGRTWLARSTSLMRSLVVDAMRARSR